MTGDRRKDLVVAAIMVSLLVHCAMMFLAKPMVMTRVAAGVRHGERRAPMRVTDRLPRPDPAAVSAVSDESAAKAPPPVAGGAELLPSADVAAPGKVAEEKVPTPVISVESPAAGTDVALPVPEVIRAAAAADAVMPKMEIETAVAGEIRSESLLTASGMPGAAADFQTPAFSPVSSPAEVSEDVAKLTPDAKERKEEFKPMEEVMPAVDEKIVEREKAAVRDIMDTGNSLDLASVVNVSASRCADGGYTYFRLVIAPKGRVPAVPKDLVVLMDASGSIGQDRLSRCRKHAKEILRTAMNTGDRFNLVAFRDRFAYAFRTWQPCEAASYAAADRWMAKLAAHGRTDVFASVASVLTLPRDPTRPIVALMVTDGEANSGVSATAEILSKFAKLNDGLVSVYMYGVKSSANRELIDVMTRGNRGESMVFEGWRWNAGEGLEAFSERFRDPVVTDLRMVFPAACRVETYPVLLRNLYRGNGVSVYGRVAGAPDSVTFSLRGIAGRTPYEGFFRIPLAKAAGDMSIVESWRSEKAVAERLR